MNDTLTYQHLVGAVRKAESEVAEKERELHLAQQLLSAAENVVIEAMLSEEIPSKFTDAFGNEWKLDNAVKVIPAEKDANDAVCEWIARNGGANLATASINWQRRNAFLKEKFWNDETRSYTPDPEIEDLVKLDTFPRLKRPKA